MHLFGKEGINVSDTILHVEQVEKGIHGKTILQPISFKLKSGRALALCGGSGAGKSTLIRMIVGLTQTTKGEITLNGMTKKSHKKQYVKSIGYMPDDFQFQSAVTAKETIKFYADLKGVNQQRIDAIIKQVGLTEHLNKSMGAFSKGMRQRMLLAQALLTNPPLIVLDEPTNGLDPYWVKSFGNMILDAKKRGQTVVFSTHDLHVAEEIADDIIFLYDGKVISSGPIEEYQKTGLYNTFQHLVLNLT